MTAGERDGLESILAELVRSAEERLDSHLSPGLRFDGLPKDEGEVGELIEGMTRITLLFHSNGFRENEVHVRVQVRSIEIDTPGFVLRRRVPLVDPRTARITCRNGIVSVVVDRDGYSK